MINPKKQKGKMKRSDFVKTAVRYLLYGLLALIAVITGTRTSSGADCSACSGKGICSGEIDCSRYIRK